jgi:antitoxin PrlF
MTPQELRDWRQALKFSQEKAAHALGVTTRAYTKWESGETPIAERVKLAAQMYLRLHRTARGNNGSLLLYTARVSENETNRVPLNCYLVFARNEHEASKLVYQELEQPPQITLTFEAVADAPEEETPKVLGSIEEIARTAALRHALHQGQGNEITYEIEDDRVILRKVARDSAADDPFATFEEWSSEADAKAYGGL